MPRCALGLLLFDLDPFVGIICENPQLSYIFASVGSAAGEGEVHSATRFTGEWNCKYFEKLLLKQGKPLRNCNRQFLKEFITLGFDPLTLPFGRSIVRMMENQTNDVAL
jgi:hypothetical protein